MREPEGLRVQMRPRTNLALRVQMRTASNSCAASGSRLLFPLTFLSIMPQMNSRQRNIVQGRRCDVSSD